MLAPVRAFQAPFRANLGCSRHPPRRLARNADMTSETGPSRACAGCSGRRRMVSHVRAAEAPPRSRAPRASRPAPGVARRRAGARDRRRGAAPSRAQARERARAAPPRRDRAQPDRARRLPHLRPLTSAGTAAGSAPGPRTGSTSCFGKVAYVAPGDVRLRGGADPEAVPARDQAAAHRRDLPPRRACCSPSPPRPRGLGPDQPPRGDSFDSTWFPHHGGLAGRGALLGHSTLFQRIGAHIIALLLIAAGALLLTGTSIATFLRGHRPGAHRARARAAARWRARSPSRARRSAVPRPSSETAVDPTDRHDYDVEEDVTAADSKTSSTRR